MQELDVLYAHTADADSEPLLMLDTRSVGNSPKTKDSDELEP